MRKNYDLSDLPTEIEACAALVSALQCHVDEEHTGDRLTASRLELAMYGVIRHLERVSQDVDQIDRLYDLTAKGVTA